MVRSKKTDPSKEYHFRLVSRSLADPLADVPGESQNVLQPFVPQNLRKKGRGPTAAPGTALGLSEEVFGVHENLNEEERELLKRAVSVHRFADRICGCFVGTDSAPSIRSQ